MRSGSVNTVLVSLVAVILKETVAHSEIRSTSRCKLTPNDPAWPSTAEWATLNSTIDGVLIKSRPVASSCYPGNPLNSPESCEIVSAAWNTSAFHFEWPESVSFPLFANNSCLPPSAPGYPSPGCTYGGCEHYVHKRG